MRKEGVLKGWEVGENYATMLKFRSRTKVIGWKPRKKEAGPEMQGTRYWTLTNLKHNLFSVNLLFHPNSIQHPGHFLFRVFNSGHDAGWRRYVTGIPSIFSY